MSTSASLDLIELQANPLGRPPQVSAIAPRDIALTGPAEFVARVRLRDGTTVVHIAGELDVSTAGALREVLSHRAVLGAPRVRIDLTEMAFLGALGLGVLVTACKRIRASGGTCAVVCDRGGCQHVLEISDLTEYLQVEGPL